MARKLRGLERVLDAPSLFAIAYSEIASSIYFALGIVAAQALGLTPVVILASGLLFLVVASSYAEGTSAIPETGGAATFTRRAFNDLAGFVTGWALFLDYLIVFALSALFLPHYLGAALSAPTLRESPWDVVIAVAVIAGLIVLRAVRRTPAHRAVIGLAILDLCVQVLVLALGFALVFSPETLVQGLDLATDQGWRDVAFALPLAMLAYTGLETVANLAEEAREPGRDLPRSTFASAGVAVVTTTLIAVVAVTAYPSEDGTTELGDRWLEAPIVGIVSAFEGHLPAGVVGALRVVVGVSGALILLAAASASVSGSTRLARSMAAHGMLPRSLGRLHRRSLVSRPATIAFGLLGAALVVGVGVLAGDDPAVLASLYSFGILLAFTAAQLAVVKLRYSEPRLARPYRSRPEVTVRGVRVPLAALVGAPLTFTVWILALATHPAARYAGPAWIAAGVVVYAVVRSRRERGLLDDVDPIAVLPRGAEFHKVLVPMKLGDVGDEMVATAIALAKESTAIVEALHVIAVPRDRSLEMPLTAELEARARDALEEARSLGEENGVAIGVSTVRSRSIGQAIVDEASRRGSDLIILGSAARWRRQSRFFSPTVDFVLRHATCEVLVVAFPDGVFDE